MNAPGIRPALSGAAILMLGACLSAAAADKVPSTRFSVQGSATVARDPKPLVGEHFTMRGQLVSSDAPSSAPIVQEGGRFVLMARTIAVAQACYNDTIFRDDFDGDGR